ncbi:hypothetical protein HRbin41_00821 [bacterium HR41]|nr:hypothetical protein HRbin41_00821 [bacterium HR41]
MTSSPGRGIDPLLPGLDRLSGARPAGRVETPPRGAPPTAGPSFAEHLERAASQRLVFSKHASERLARRGIELDPERLSRLAAGVERAAAKGSRDSVVFVDGVAFVVAVKNRTVVTAVDHEHMREHVFTNIDSAVIA